MTKILLGDVDKRMDSRSISQILSNSATVFGVWKIVRCTWAVCLVGFIWQWNKISTSIYHQVLSSLSENFNYQVYSLLLFSYIEDCFFYIAIKDSIPFMVHMAVCFRYYSFTYSLIRLWNALHLRNLVGHFFSQLYISAWKPVTQLLIGCDIRCQDVLSNNPLQQKS